MKLYPLFADLSGRPVLVVGGGVVGERKAAALLEAGAQVIVGAPGLTPALRTWVQGGRVQWLRGTFEEKWLDGVWLVIAATSDTELHRQIATLAEARRVFVNVVDDAEASSFHVPAVIDRSPVTIAISSGGHAPMLARLLRERLEVAIDPVIGSVASLLAQMRQRIRAHLPDVSLRRRFYERLLHGPVQSLLRRGQWALAEASAERLLDATETTPRLFGSGSPPGDRYIT